MGESGLMRAIERYRRDKGLTKEELAAQVGVSLKTIQAWESYSIPRPENLTRLAEVFGIDEPRLQQEILESR